MMNKYVSSNPVLVECVVYRCCQWHTVFKQPWYVANKMCEPYQRAVFGHVDARLRSRFRWLRPALHATAQQVISFAGAKLLLCCKGTSQAECIR